MLFAQILKTKKNDLFYTINGYKDAKNKQEKYIIIIENDMQQLQESI